MKYQDIREHIKSGDVLAWSHRSWKTWKDIKIQLVRFFTQSEYAHVGTAWVVGERVFVIEAVVPLVRIYPLSKLGEFYWLPMDAPWREYTEVIALEKIGFPYSEVEAVKAFLSLPLDDSVWECAELTAESAKADGIDLGKKYTPTAIVQAALKLGKRLHFIEQ